MTPRLHFVDATLREGEQAPGVALTGEEKLDLAVRILEAGVTLLDAGMPCASPEEREFFAEAVVRLGAGKVGASLRVREEDLDLTLHTGTRELFLILPVSSRHIHARLGETSRSLARRASQLVRRAVEAGATVSLAAEDASRSSPSEAVAVLREAVEAGASRVFLCDTVGVWHPAACGEYMRQVFEAIQPASLGIHCHNDYGLALANTLAAASQGATWLSVTVNGIGERCGNADLAQTACASRDLLGWETGIDPSRLWPLARKVEALTGIPLAPGSPLVGDVAFTHTSGIHVHGQRRDAQAYEGPDPLPLGRRHRVAFSPRSGRSSRPGATAEELKNLRDESGNRCRIRRDHFLPALHEYRNSLPQEEGE